MGKKSHIKFILILSLIFVIGFSAILTNISNATETRMGVSTISSENLSWGIAATGLDKYVDKLTKAGNDVEIKIAILDTGINLDHEVFEGRLDLDPNYARDFANYDDVIEDLSGTGTAIASIIAQGTPSNVKIIPVKVVNYESEIFFKLDELYNGLKAVANYADIIVFGIGINPIIPTEEQIDGLRNTLAGELYNDDTVLLSNVGDLSTASNKVSVHFPAFLENFINATAVDTDMNVPETACVGDRVDFALPGVDIKVASNTSNTGYTTVSGTRYALGYLAAAYANVKAELRAEDPESQAEDFVNVLKENTIDLGEEGKDNIYGYGYIDFNSNMFSKVEVNVENKTVSKATVTFDSNNSSSTDFIAEAGEGSFTVTCESPCFVLLTKDDGENYSILSGTELDTNKYSFEFDLEEGTTIVVAIKGDVNFSGTLNNRDITALMNAYSTGGLSSLEKIICDVNGSGALNNRDITFLMNVYGRYDNVSW